MPSNCRRLILDNNLILAICKCDCGIFIYEVDYVIMDWRTLQRPIVVIMIWSLYGSMIIWRCENDFESYLKHSKPRWCVLRLISHWRCKGTSSKVKPSLSYIKICDESDSFIIRIKVWLVHKCSSLFQCNFGLEKCFLVRKLYQKIGGHMLTPKIGTHQVCWTIWADQSDLSWKPVRPVKTSLSYCKLDFTIA